MLLHFFKESKTNRQHNRRKGEKQSRSIADRINQFIPESPGSATVNFTNKCHQSVSTHTPSPPSINNSAIRNDNPPHAHLIRSSLSTLVAFQPSDGVETLDLVQRGAALCADCWHTDGAKGCTAAAERREPRPPLTAEGRGVGRYESV